jgi:hypothetical protein
MLSNTWARCIASALLLALFPVSAIAEVYVSVNIAPPELPVYDQPPIPADGYLWTPGYWAWSDEIQDYYWVPGTWVEPPQPEYLWTPGYWAASDGVYFWRPGYWGPTVGFYGGVNYGYGYGGRGYEGGYWDRGRLYYNRSVVNIGSTRINNVYNRTVVNNVTNNRVSFNGGNGGVRAQPTGAELSAERGHHIAVTPMQRDQEQAARTNPELRAATNHGNPPIAATPRAGNFSNPVPAQHAGTAGVERPNPQPRMSTPRPGPDAAPFVPQRHVTTNQEVTPNREVVPNRQVAPNQQVAPNRQVAPNQQVTPSREVAPTREVAPNRFAAPTQNVRPPPPQAREPARVEPQRQPAQTQQTRPPPQPAPREQPRPAAPRPEDHEHH